MDQQTATSEILRVISSSLTDIQPVFDAIVRSAVPLCDAMLGAVFRFDGELMHLAAPHNYTPEALQALQDLLPLRPQEDSPLTAARAILARAVVHVPDVQADGGYAHYVAQTGGFRGLLAVPMLREGSPIGAIFVGRRQAGPFSTAQIELLNEPTRARLYGLRSALAHGRSLLHIDEIPWSGLINPPNALDQDETYRSLGRLVKRVLVGWLWERTPAA